MENNPNMTVSSSSNKLGIVVALAVGIIFGLLIGNILPKSAINQKGQTVSTQSSDFATISYSSNTQVVTTLKDFIRVLLKRGYISTQIENISKLVSCRVTDTSSANKSPWVDLGGGCDEDLPEEEGEECIASSWFNTETGEMTINWGTAHYGSDGSCSCNVNASPVYDNMNPPAQ